MTTQRRVISAMLLPLVVICLQPATSHAVPTYGLSVSTAAPIAGQTFTVSWQLSASASTPQAFPAQDFVGIAMLGSQAKYFYDNGLNEDTFRYVPAGARSGSLSIRAPSTAGSYEVRYAPYQFAFESDARVIINVQPAPAGSATYGLSVSNVAPTAGQTFTVSWQLSPAVSTPAASPLRDFIGIAPAGSAISYFFDSGIDEETYRFVPAGARSGSVTMRAPSIAGSYEVRYAPYQFTFVAQQKLVINVQPGVSGLPPGQGFVWIEGAVVDANGVPLTNPAVKIDPYGTLSTCGPTRSQQSSASYACTGPTYAAKTVVNTSGRARMKVKVPTSMGLVVSMCTKNGRYDCHERGAYCRPYRGGSGTSAIAYVDVNLPPGPTEFVDVRLKYTNGPATAYPACDKMSADPRYDSTSVRTLDSTKGDFDTSGWVTASDAINVQRCAAGLKASKSCSARLWRGDVDCDGRLTSTDADSIRRLAEQLPVTICSDRTEVRVDVIDTFARLGYNGAVDSIKARQSAGAVQLFNCIGYPVTTCDVTVPSKSIVAGVIPSAVACMVPKTTSDLTGSITYAGDLSNVQHAELSQQVEVEFYNLQSPQPSAPPCPTCSGAHVGDSGVCQGGPNNGNGCVVGGEFPDLGGNTSADCLPNGTPWDIFVTDNGTLTTGAVTLASNQPCSHPTGCHCPQQPLANWCEPFGTGVCGADWKCVQPGPSGRDVPCFPDTINWSGHTGGKHCVGGTDFGTVCDSAADCSEGTCTKSIDLVSLGCATVVGPNRTGGTPFLKATLGLPGPLARMLTLSFSSMP